jgi:hypothetical protein
VQTVHPPALRLTPAAPRFVARPWPRATGAGTVHPSQPATPSQETAMTTRSHIAALALAAFATAAVLAGIGQIAEPGAPAQLFAQAVQALASARA